MGPFKKGHMQHHLELYPPSDLVSEKYRSAKWYHSGPLLFSPAFVVIMGIAGTITWQLGWPAWVTLTLCSVLLGFGFMSDAVHDSFHIIMHPLSRFKWWQKARELHFLHHRNMKVNFGIFVFTFDRVFKTFREWEKRNW